MIKQVLTSLGGLFSTKRREQEYRVVMAHRHAQIKALCDEMMEDLTTTNRLLASDILDADKEHLMAQYRDRMWLRRVQMMGISSAPMR